MTTITDTPNICIRCVECRNNGTSRFDWVNLDDLQDFELCGICANPSHINFEVSDTSNTPKFSTLGEALQFARFVDLIQADQPELSYEIARKIWEKTRIKDIIDTVEKFEGIHDSIRDFLDEFLFHNHDVSSELVMNHLDYDGIWDELKTDGFQAIEIDENTVLIVEMKVY